MRRRARPLLHAPTEGQNVAGGLQLAGPDARTHPLELVREQAPERPLGAGGRLAGLPSGSPVHVAGLVLMRQQPGSAKGVTFLTLEDETGPVNIIVWESIGAQQRRPMIESRSARGAGGAAARASRHACDRAQLVDRHTGWRALLARSRDFH